ncbi:uncharacterized protein Z519_01877 [Cladophialophora bantiana CBS 173.52]|uniref:Adenylate kinase n=1 Tax=Cladophialophora bantiana (strain ATCC 10958 / CBS 173.52 / CDC B-1940 / NIH 8579) TaxID=1442370 RepID=A0A0D2HXY7_CLAB1|nr:uncharacterized protein Z519_01877 [Cladophialophora bantiana CBS 173.52]KIW98293.1 hypothetical protein Z519_01877 [Cladophialophora bantiana CBS 173.52]
MAERESRLNSKYPLMIFIVGVPGSFAREIGQQIAYEYGFFFIGISQRFKVAQEEQTDARFLLGHNGNNNNNNNKRRLRYTTLPYVGSWRLDQKVGTFLRETKHLQNRACLVIEGYPRHTRHIPDFWRAAQRLFVYCECPKPAAEMRAVGSPLDWDSSAPADRREREETGWNEGDVGSRYWNAKHSFDEDWGFFETRLTSLLGPFMNNNNIVGGSDSWRAVWRNLLRESFTPGKVVAVRTGEGDFDDCWIRAKEALENSIEFRTLLSEIEQDFETIADENSVEEADQE